jgi:hypothetical protein
MEEGFKLQHLKGNQNFNIFRIRIFVDYTQLTTGGPTEINTIKRVVNITASYFYNVLNVTRLDRLFFPTNTSQKCNKIII